MTAVRMGALQAIALPDPVEALPRIIMTQDQPHDCQRSQVGGGISTPQDIS
jgi:hypothetical protein